MEVLTLCRSAFTSDLEFAESVISQAKEAVEDALASVAGTIKQSAPEEILRIMALVAEITELTSVSLDAIDALNAELLMLHAVESEIGRLEALPDQTDSLRVAKNAYVIVISIVTARLASVLKISHRISAELSYLRNSSGMTL